MRKLKVTGEIAVPDDVAEAIIEKYQSEVAGYIKYTVNFYVNLDNFTRYNVDIPIYLHQIIE